MMIESYCRNCGGKGYLTHFNNNGSNHWCCSCQGSGRNVYDKDYIERMDKKGIEMGWKTERDRDIKWGDITEIAPDKEVERRSVKDRRQGGS